ncbi:hypothetical protein [Acaryochloris marina]|uniref:Uncharacterized protein n=1 Tax=Acaryochloris marina (strain MBIC 11017) TaxID=329726 RepID=A8ZQD8_ACAM1|nr:hypothetical protein [Acaryochloris marina]ABW33224.1 hypothetical protein AM1_G0044 [Acaryochloris marina MBIC11017]
MAPQLISLKPKPPAQPTLKTPTNIESNSAYSGKTAFPTIARKDDLPLKRKPSPDAGDDERKRESAPIHIHREPDFARRTQRGYTARHTTSRTQPPRVSRAFESKFNALERRQKNLIQQTKQKGQLEYLTVSQSSLGNFWITIEGSGKPFIKISFETPEFCFECALELENTFDVLQVIKLRPGETIERIEEMIGVWLDRERVCRVWG